MTWPSPVAVVRSDRRAAGRPNTKQRGTPPPRRMKAGDGGDSEEGWGGEEGRGGRAARAAAAGRSPQRRPPGLQGRTTGRHDAAPLWAWMPIHNLSLGGLHAQVNGTAGRSGGVLGAGRPTTRDRQSALLRWPPAGAGAARLGDVNSKRPRPAGAYATRRPQATCIQRRSTCTRIEHQPPPSSLQPPSRPNRALPTASSSRQADMPPRPPLASPADLPHASLTLSRPS